MPNSKDYSIPLCDLDGYKIGEVIDIRHPDNEPSHFIFRTDDGYEAGIEYTRAYTAVISKPRERFA